MKQGPVKNWKVRGPRPGNAAPPDPFHAVNIADLVGLSGGGGAPPVGLIAVLDDRYVNVEGDTMDGTAGTLTLPRDPAAPLEAATKAYVDANVGTPFPEAPIDGTPYARQDAGWVGIPPGTFVDAPVDGTPYERQDAAWVPAGAAQTLDAGTGLTIDPATTPNPTINLDPATDTTLGGITEPPPDAKGYVRTTQLTGVSQWVPPADPASVHYGVGLSIDEATRTVDLQPAGFGDPKFLGGIYEPPMDGVAHSRQFDALTQTWVWTPALTAGLQITSIIPDKAIYGPGQPLLTVHAYGAEFTTTTRAVIDGVDTATTILSANELTFVLNPQVPVQEQFHIITVRDPAVPETGLGAEQFDFIKASTEVDYGDGLTLDTAPTPPIVNLQPATDFSIGGLKEPLQEAGKQWVREFDPTLPEGWKWSEAKDTGIGDVPPNPPVQWMRTTGRWVEYVPPPDSGGIGDVPVTPVALWVRSPGRWQELPEQLNRDDFVEKIGDTMRGPLVLDGPPTQPLHAATKDYVDLSEPQEAPHDGNTYGRNNGQWVELPEDGGIGEPPMTPVAVWGRTPDRGWTPVPTFDDVEGYVSKIGDTMTGRLVLAGAPEYPLEAATKDYVDLREPQEAQHNGKTYGRKDGQWVEIEPTESGGIGDVPNDPVQPWSRTPGRWVAAVDKETVDGKVDKFGDTMTGYLTLNAIPVYPLHAATKDYVDLNDIGEAPNDGKQYVRQDSHWVEVDIPEEASGIGDVPLTPTHPWSRTTGRWVEAPTVEAVEAKVDKIGDTMTGPLTLAGPPTYPLHAVTKDYVDLHDIGEAPTDGMAYARINASWDALPAALQDVPKALDAKVDRIGDTMTGPLVLAGPPTQPRHATTMDWVDLNYLKDAPNDDQTYGRKGGLWEPTVGFEEAPIDGNLWGRQDGEWASVSHQLRNKVDKAGDTMSGHLNLPGFPEYGTHAASKAYVDSRTAGVIIATEPPADAEPGALWFESDSADLFIRYDDGDSVQWVQATDPGIPEAPKDGLGYWRRDEAWEAASIFLDRKVNTSGDWMSGPLGLPAGDPTDPHHATPKSYVDRLVDGAKIAVGDDPPLDPEENQLWWESDTGALFIWWNDGDSTQWVQVVGGDASSVQEAPIDGTPYARQDATWVAAGAGGGLADAPSDGTEYVRKDAAWVNPTAASGAYLPLDGSAPMTGDLSISKASTMPGMDPIGAQIVLSKTDVAQAVGISAQNQDGTESWKMTLSSGEIPGLPGYADKIQFVRSNAIQFEIDASGNTVISGNLTVYGTFTDALLMEAMPGKSTGELLLNALDRIESLQACCDESKARITQLETALKARR